jgi:tetratricopeptide (TPR) repeat protein
MATSKRLPILEKMVATGSNDPMALYALAMEYRSLERYEESFATFERLRAAHPDYVAQYLMCATVLEKLGRGGEQKSWLSAGVDAARAKRDTHALGELEAALAALG